MKSCKSVLQDFFSPLFSHKPFHCTVKLRFLSSALLSSNQPVTWAVTVARSQTCWTRAFRSARSVSSSQPTTASSSCVASGTRASGFTPPTQVEYYLSSWVLIPDKLPSVSCTFRHAHFNPYFCRFVSILIQYLINFTYNMKHSAACFCVSTKT